MKSKSFSTFSTLFYPPSGLSSRQFIVAAYILTVYVVDIEVKTDNQNNCNNRIDDGLGTNTMIWDVNGRDLSCEGVERVEGILGMDRENGA